MQSVWRPEKTSWKATFWAGDKGCIQTRKMLSHSTIVQILSTAVYISQHLVTRVHTKKV